MDFERHVNPTEALYHGAYVCPNHCDDDEPAPVERPLGGCSGGRCSECGEEKVYVDVLSEVHGELPDTRNPGRGTLRLTANEARTGAKELA